MILYSALYSVCTFGGVTWANTVKAGLWPMLIFILHLQLCLENHLEVTPSVSVWWGTSTTEVDYSIDSGGLSHQKLSTVKPNWSFRLTASQTHTVCYPIVKWLVNLAVNEERWNSESADSVKQKHDETRLLTVFSLNKCPWIQGQQWDEIKWIFNVEHWIWCIQILMHTLNTVVIC